MGFEIILLPVLLAFATFIFHARPRFYNKYFGVDAWRHLLIIDYIRKNKRVSLTSVENQLFKGPFDYPPAVLSFFPEDSWRSIKALYHLLEIKTGEIHV